jgi:predicted nucleotidyltransferase
MVIITEPGGCYKREKADGSMKQHRIEIPKEELSGFCRRHGIRKLSFFGSVLRDDFREDSDIDVLVEFEPGVSVGLRFFAMERELSELLGRKVDLNTPGFLGKYIRDEALAEAEVQYVSA